MRLAVILSIILFIPGLVSAGEGGWQVAKSTHFNIFYKNAPEQLVDELIQKAESCYDSIAEELGFNRFNFWTWDNRAKIYLFDNRDEYKKATQTYDWSGGQVNVRNKIIQSYVGAPRFVNNILPHELAHIILLEMVGYNRGIPLWLQEGVAVYQEQDIHSVKIDMARRIKDDDYIDFNRLNAFNLESSENEEVRLFYAESYSIVKYLISEFGKDAFVEFCRSLRDKRSFSAALSKTYSFKNLTELEDSWKTYILK